jgi:hypothetical protein
MFSTCGCCRLIRTHRLSVPTLDRKGNSLEEKEFAAVDYEIGRPKVRKLIKAVQHAMKMYGGVEARFPIRNLCTTCTWVEPPERLVNDAKLREAGWARESNAHNNNNSIEFNSLLFMC